MKRRHVKVGFPRCVYCFSFFFFQIFCEERYMYNSTPEVQETKNSSLALFDLEGVSLIYCGRRCLTQHCCKEFIYHKGSMRCLGIHFEDFDSTSNTKMIRTGNEGLSTYRKGNLVYITFLFPLVFSCLVMSPLHNIWYCYSLSLSIILSLSFYFSVSLFLSVNYRNDSRGICYNFIGKMCCLKIEKNVLIYYNSKSDTTNLKKIFTMQITLVMNTYLLASKKIFHLVNELITTSIYTIAEKHILYAIVYIEV